MVIKIFFQHKNGVKKERVKFRRKEEEDDGDFL